MDAESKFALSISTSPALLLTFTWLSVFEIPNCVFFSSFSLDGGYTPAGCLLSGDTYLNLSRDPAVTACFFSSSAGISIFLFLFGTSGASTVFFLILGFFSAFLNSLVMVLQAPIEVMTGFSLTSSSACSKPSSFLLAGTNPNVVGFLPLSLKTGSFLVPTCLNVSYFFLEFILIGAPSSSSSSTVIYSSYLTFGVKFLAPMLK